MKKIFILILLLFPFASNSQMVVNPYMYSTPSGGSGYDTDAQNIIDYINTTGITLNTTQEGCIDNLIVAAKSHSWWTSIVAAYGFAGGTANSHATDWKNPNSATFRIVWGGTLTHNANGVTGSSNGYGITNIIPRTHTSENDMSISVYLFSPDLASGDYNYLFGASGSGRIYGIQTATTSGTILISGGIAQTSTYIGNYDAGVNGGYFSIDRSSSTFTALYDNTTQAVTSNQVSSTTFSGARMSLMAINSSSTTTPSIIAGSYTTATISWADVSTSLSQTVHANKAADIETYQDCMSRGVIP